MKTALLLLFCSLPAFSQSQPDPNQAATAQKFKQLEASAPKGYPTPFVVASAVSQPGQLLGREQSCAMNIETLGQVYYVTAMQGFTAACKVYAPGTVMYGHVHQLLGQVVDLLDTTGAKPKSHRYTVENVALVDPSQQ
ncbi:MAG TPA: hypothetical protein VN828_03730 [Acidobacteriaceae bacterium]|nr:hypothetical protein [Acidobacteriaceae bacterium]